MKRQHVILLVTCLVLGASSASAQDTGRVGLAMGYPRSVAAIWHVTDAFAIRPEVDLLRSSVTHGDRTTTQLMTSVGVSGIFYVATQDNLRPYVSPRIAYNRISGTIRSGAVNVDTTYSGYVAGGSMGAQYAIGRRFSAYGELGVMYTHTGVRGELGDRSGNAVSRWSAVGVIVYF